MISQEVSWLHRNLQILRFRTHSRWQNQQSHLCPLNPISRAWWNAILSPPILHSLPVKWCLMLCTSLIHSTYHFLLCRVGICVYVSFAESDFKLLTHGGCSVNRYWFRQVYVLWVLCSELVKVLLGKDWDIEPRLRLSKSLHLYRDKKIAKY